MSRFPAQALWGMEGAWPAGGARLPAPSLPGSQQSRCAPRWLPVLLGDPRSHQSLAHLRGRAECTLAGAPVSCPPWGQLWLLGGALPGRDAQGSGGGRRLLPRRLSSSDSSCEARGSPGRGCWLISVSPGGRRRVFSARVAAGCSKQERRVPEGQRSDPWGVCASSPLCRMGNHSSPETHTAPGILCCLSAPPWCS